MDWRERSVSRVAGSTCAACAHLWMEDVQRDEREASRVSLEEFYGGFGVWGALLGTLEQRGLGGARRLGVSQLAQHKQLAADESTTDSENSRFVQQSHRNGR